MNKDLLFFNIWISDWNKFINIHTNFLSKEKNINFLSVFDSFIHNDKNIELNNKFLSLNFRYYYQKSYLIKYLYQYFLNQQNFSHIKYICFLFENNISISNLNILSNLDINNNSNNSSIFFIKELNSYIYPIKIMNILISYLKNDENINDSFYIEKIKNIFNFNIILSNLNNSNNLDKNDLFLNYYDKINKFIKDIDLKIQQTWIIDINNFNDFNIQYILFLLYLPFEKYNIFIILNKKVQNKIQIYESLKPLLEKNNNLYLIFDFPHIHLEQCIEDLILFSNYNEKIYSFNINLLKNIFNNDIQNLNLELLFNHKIENKNNKKIPYNELDYYRLIYINEKNINYIIYHKNFIDSKTILNIKKNYILYNSSNQSNKLIKLSNNIELKETYRIDQCQFSRLSDFVGTYDFDNFIKEFKCKTELINLEKRYDRFCRIYDEFEFYKINYNRFNGILIKNIEDLKNLNIIDWENLIKNKKDKNYIFGSTGCKLSHIKIYEKYINQIKSEDLDFLIIFEDDFIFRKDIGYPFYYIKEALNELKKNNIDWDLIYLNSTNNEFEEKDLKYLKKIKKKTGFTTSSYLVSIKKISNILNLLKSNKKEIDVVFTENLEERYLIIPQLGYQIESFSDILNKNVNYNYL